MKHLCWYSLTKRHSQNIYGIDNIKYSHINAIGRRFKAMGQDSCLSICTNSSQVSAVFKKLHKGTNHIGSQDTAK